MLYIVDEIFLFLKPIKRNDYLVCTVDTDDLVLQHRGISCHSAEYTSMHFQLFVD